MCLFWPILSIFNEIKVAIANKFFGLFNSHNLYQLAKTKQAIKFSLIKCNLLRQVSNNLQTPLEVDLKSRSDFVFTVSIKIHLHKKI